MEKAPASNSNMFDEALNPSAWRLFGSSPSLLLAAPAVAVSSNPSQEQHIDHHPQLPQSSASDVMAYQRADPSPFIPEHLQHEDIANREFMIRAVAPVTPPARNEDLAIVTIDPLPGNPMHFAAVRGVIRDFLQLEKRV